MRTTQDYFHSMRGHVAQDCEIQMNNGDLVMLDADHHGWVMYQVVDGKRKFHANAGFSAHVVECLVYSYPSLDI